MRALIKTIAVFVAVSVLATMWFIVAITANGSLPSLFDAGALGVLTLAGWAVSLVAGPIAAVQLWRLRKSGRTAGLIFFGSGLAYYVLGVLWLRAPEASIKMIVVAILVFAVPFAILLSPPAWRVLSFAANRDQRTAKSE